MNLTAFNLAAIACESEPPTYPTLQSIKSRLHSFDCSVATARKMSDKLNQTFCKIEVWCLPIMPSGLQCSSPLSVFVNPCWAKQFAHYAKYAQMKGTFYRPKGSSRQCVSNQLDGFSLFFCALWSWSADCESFESTIFYCSTLMHRPWQDCSYWIATHGNGFLKTRLTGTNIRRHVAGMYQISKYCLFLYARWTHRSLQHFLAQDWPSWTWGHLAWQTLKWIILCMVVSPVWTTFLDWGSWRCMILFFGRKDLFWPPLSIWAGRFRSNTL